MLPYYFVVDFPYSFYIGLVRSQPHQNQFEWSDGTSLASNNWHNWYIGEPNNHGGPENCVTMGLSFQGHRGLQWNDVPCSLQSRFICQRRKRENRGLKWIFVFICLQITLLFFVTNLEESLSCLFKNNALVVVHTAKKE